MADIFDWSATAASNTTCDGINCNTGMPMGNTDNLFRSIMALVRNSFSSALETFLNGTAALPVANGGSGATSATDARSNLSAAKSGANSDITSLSGLTTPLSLAQGGTGAATQANAFAAIAVVASSLASTGYLKLANGLILQWGSASVGSGNTAITYPTAYSSFSVAVASGGNTGVSQINGPYTLSCSTASFTVHADTSATAFWLAVGV